MNDFLWQLYHSNRVQISPKDIWFFGTKYLTKMKQNISEMVHDYVHFGDYSYTGGFYL